MRPRRYLCKLNAPAAEPRRLPPQGTEFPKVQAAIKPAGAGCPHPSRCSAKAQHRATFPKGKAKAALESQTPQREPRRLPPRGTDLALLSKLGVNAMPCRRHNPSAFSAFIVRGRQVCGTGTPGCPMAACRIRKGCRRLCPPQAHAGTLRRRRRRFR